MTDKVSIVTILHGETEFIPLILDNYKNFKDSDNLELVVVDDGKENLSSYFKEIKNCFYFHFDVEEKEKFIDQIIEGYKQPNSSGLKYLKKKKSLPDGFKRDYGCGMSSHPYIFHMNYDCIYHKKSIERKFKFMKKIGAEKGIKVTFLPFLMKALSIVLKEMPEFNSSLDHNNQNLVLKNYYHLGVAVDTPSGLTVPIVRDVDQKSVFELSDELMDLSSRARDKKLKPDELKGGTFTVSSLGGIGGTGFSPIGNPPEVAIMGVSRSAWKEVYDKTSREFVAKFIMPFSLSYDHRVIDGAAAAAFTSRFADVLSDLDHFKD